MTKRTAFIASLALAALTTQAGYAQETTTTTIAPPPATATTSGLPTAAPTEGTSAMTVTTPVQDTATLTGRPSLGLRTGYVNTEGDQKETMDFAVEAGYRPATMLGTAIELGGYATPRLVNGSSLSRLSLLAKATFQPAWNIPVIKYSFIGAGIGPVYDHVGSLRKLSLGVAPTIGIDIPVGKITDSPSQFTVGAAASYMFVSNAMDDSYSIGGTAKYWY